MSKEYNDYVKSLRKKCEECGVEIGFQHKEGCSVEKEQVKDYTLKDWNNCHGAWYLSRHRLDFIRDIVKDIVANFHKWEWCENAGRTCTPSTFELRYINNPYEDLHFDSAGLVWSDWNIFTKKESQLLMQTIRGGISLHSELDNTMAEKFVAYKLKPKGIDKLKSVLLSC
jgi:hypothetical protein